MIVSQKSQRRSDMVRKRVSIALLSGSLLPLRRNFGGARGQVKDDPQTTQISSDQEGNLWIQFYFFASGISRLASRKISQRPSEFFRRIVRMCPERTVADPPAGVMVTFRKLCIQAQSPRTLISSMRLSASSFESC